MHKHYAEQFAFGIGYFNMYALCNSGLVIKACLSEATASEVAWWPNHRYDVYERNGRASDLRSRGREFDPRPGRGCVTTLGKLFAPNCLDDDNIR